MPQDTSYTTGRKEPVRRMTTAGEVEDWWRIHATSKGGTPFWIMVRDADLAQAPAMMAAKAKQLDGI